MAARPSERPEWATDADATISVPPNPWKFLGWIVDGIKPPNAWVNWWWNLVSEWIDHLADSIASYTDLAVAACDTEVDLNGIVVVFEDEGTVGAGIEDLDVVAITSDPEGGIDCNGKLVVYATGNADLVGMDRDLTGANGTGNLIDFVRTNAGIVRDVRCEENMVVAAYGDFAEAWNATTGASLWVFDSGGVPVRGIAIGADGVYVCHTITTGGGDATTDRHIHKLNKTTGAVIWSFQHSATALSRVFKIATNSRQLFLVGDVSSFDATTGFRSINASDGTDFAGDGNNGIDTEFLSWNRAFSLLKWVDCAHGLVYVSFSSAATEQVIAVGQGNGETSWTYAHADATVSAECLAVDQDYVLAAFSDGAGPSKGRLEALDPMTGSVIWAWGEPDGGGSPFMFSASHRIASDGQKIFAVAEDITKVWRVTRGNVPVELRRSDADEFDTMRNWILQPTERRV